MDEGSNDGEGEGEGDSAKGGSASTHSAWAKAALASAFDATRPRSARELNEDLRHLVLLCAKLFPNVFDLDELTLDRVHFHSLRHTCVMLLFSAGLEDLEIARWLGVHVNN